MDYSLQIQKILIQIDATAQWTDKVSLTKQAIALADLHNDIEWGYDLRIILMESSDGINKCNEALPAFAWLLDACDRNPDLFDENDLLWKYKWMIDSSARNSNISLPQIQGMLNDLKIRFEKNGFGLRGYYGISISIAFITEHISNIPQLITQREQQARDATSDMEANELYDSILYYLVTGDIDKALGFEKEIHNMGINSPRYTFSLYSCYSYYIMQSGRGEEAKHYYEKALSDLNQLEKLNYLIVNISEIMYTSSQFDLDASWGFFEQYVNWVPESEEYDAFIFSLNTLPLLKKKQGEVSLALSSKFPIYNSQNTYTMEQLYSYFYETTKELAYKFDKRNGNSECIKQVELFVK